jgi:hypothetical protein
MEGVSVVNGAVPPNLGILGKRLPEVVIRRRVVGLGMPGDELFDCDLAVIGSHSSILLWYTTE